jgi:hypothetical protein
MVNNRVDVDRNNLDALIATCKEMSLQFENYSYLFPPQMKRIVDLLSIKQSILWGGSNKYALNFDKRGTQYPNELYGINLSAGIDLHTGIITSGIPIVAQELFSGIYKVVNTNFFAAPETVVPLSTYTPDWGWDLTAPQDVSGIGIGAYYTFYQYTPYTTDVFYDGTINWGDPMTTLKPTMSSYSEWSDTDGIMQTAFSYELTKGLRLFTSAADIVYNS